MKGVGPVFSHAVGIGQRSQRLNEVIICLIGQTTYLRPTCHRASSGKKRKIVGRPES